MKTRRRDARPILNRQLSRKLRLERLEERTVFTADTWAVTVSTANRDVPAAISNTADGGYVVVGTTTYQDGADIWLNKFDSAGTLAWSKTYAGDFSVQMTAAPAELEFQNFTYDFATDVVEANDGSFYISGYSQFAPGNSSSGLQLHVDNDGDLLDAQLHSHGRFPTDRLVSVTEDTHLGVGNMTLTVKHSNSSLVGYTSFIDIGGVLYGDDALSESMSARAAIDTQSVGIAGTGNWGGSTLVFASPNGLVGARFGGGEFGGRAIAEIPAFGNNPASLVVTSQGQPVNINSPVNAIVRKLDAATLLPAWELQLYAAHAGQVVATEDGGMVVALRTDRSSLQGTGIQGGGSGFGVTLVKLSAAGSVEWAKSYGGRFNEGVEENQAGDHLVGLTKTADGYAFSISTFSFGTDDAQASSLNYWVVKTDLSGDVADMTGIVRDVTDEMIASATMIVSDRFDVAIDAVSLGATFGDSENYLFFPPTGLPEYGGTINDVTPTNLGGTSLHQDDGYYSAGTISLSANSYDLTEGFNLADKANVIFQRTGGSYGFAEVEATAVLQGGATEFGDQVFPVGSFRVRFEHRETEQSQTFEAYPNDGFDPGESVLLTLTDPRPTDGASLGQNSSAIINIINVDPEPVPGVIQFDSATYLVNENGGSIYVSFNRTGGSDGMISVDLSVLGGTAMLGGDYEDPTQTITFFDGQTTSGFFLTILDDILLEGDETISLAITNPTNTPSLLTTQQVTIKDVEAPTVSIAGAASAAVQGEAILFTLLANDPTGGVVNPSFKYTIDWGDGLVETPIAKSGLKISHTYSVAGTWTLSVMVELNQNVSSLVSRNVVVTQTRTQAGILYIGSTFLGADTYELVPTDAAGTRLSVKLSGTPVANNLKPTRVVIFAGHGNDTVTVNTARIGTKTVPLKVPLTVHAGDGNDVVTLSGSAAANLLNGDAGNDILVGGSGADTINGLAGRDILIGGLGRDLLRGGDGDDVLIAGRTSFDASTNALKALMTTWAGAGTYAGRVNALQTGAGPNLIVKAGSTKTVFNDSVVDSLFGEAGNDWFLATLSPATQKDKVTKITAEKLTATP